MSRKKTSYLSLEVVKKLGFYYTQLSPANASVEVEVEKSMNLKDLHGNSVVAVISLGRFRFTFNDVYV